MLLLAKTPKDVQSILSWALGEKEFDNVKIRIEITKMLFKQARYTDIQRATGASSATIAKVGRNLKNKTIRKYFLKGSKV